MTAPHHFKRGWDREKLAEYMLSRFSFVAKPSTVSDDLGSDFFCTLFRLEERNDHQYPVPLCSFAIQIKSNDRPFDFSPNITYLQRLEIPFFVGVLNENDKRLSFYSGENLPAFFPFVGPFKTLTIKLLERSQITDPHDPMVPRRDHYTVMFPRLLSITIDSTREELNRNVDVLQEMCSLMQRNISTNKIQEYIFEGYDGHSFRILAGPGSAQTFRNNFVKRLAESFYNLSWIYTNNPHTKEAIIEEFNIYEATFINMKNLYPTSTEILIASKFYEELRKILFDNTKA